MVPIDRRSVTLLVSVAIVISIVVGVFYWPFAPSFGDSSYVHVEPINQSAYDIEDPDVSNYTQLSDAEQREFQRALDGRVATEGDPALTEFAHPGRPIRYEGRLYHVWIAYS